MGGDADIQSEGPGFESQSGQKNKLMFTYAPSIEIFWKLYFNSNKVITI